jgi:hypothetical protein
MSKFKDPQIVFQLLNTDKNIGGFVEISCYPNVLLEILE